jgi:hypothetical protein
MFFISRLETDGGKYDIALRVGHYRVGLGESLILAPENLAVAVHQDIECPSVGFNEAFYFSAGFGAIGVDGKNPESRFGVFFIKLLD